MGLIGSIAGFGAKSTVAAYRGIGYAGRGAVAGGIIGAGIGAATARPGEGWNNAAWGAGIGAVAGGAPGYMYGRYNKKLGMCAEHFAGLEKSKNAVLKSNKPVNSARDAVSTARRQTVRTASKVASDVKGAVGGVGRRIRESAEDTWEAAFRGARRPRTRGPVPMATPVPAATSGDAVGYATKSATDFIPKAQVDMSRAGTRMGVGPRPSRSSVPMKSQSELQNLAIPKAQVDMSRAGTRMGVGPTPPLSDVPLASPYMLRSNADIARAEQQFARHPLNNQSVRRGHGERPPNAQVDMSRAGTRMGVGPRSSIVPSRSRPIASPAAGNNYGDMRTGGRFNSIGSVPTDKLTNQIQNNTWRSGYGRLGSVYA